MTSIDTAVPLLEKNDLEQPLLIETTTIEEGHSRWNNIQLGGDDDDDGEDEQKTRTSSIAASCCWGQRFLTSWQFLNGLSVGFLSPAVTEIITIIVIHSGGHLTPMWFLLTTWFLFITVICIAIVIASNVDYVGGFRFHFGSFCGCFFVWGVMDFYVGAPLGVFVALFSTLLACHSLCYGMVVLHSRFIINE